MKRFLLAFILVAATCTVGSFQRASAQTVPHISAATFTSEVNLLDSYIGAGNMAAAHATWDTVNNMMITILGYTKNSIVTAATPADKTTYINLVTNQRTIYQTIWALKTDLVTNRVALHTNLGLFDATIY